MNSVSNNKKNTASDGKYKRQIKREVKAAGIREQERQKV